MPTSVRVWSWIQWFPTVTFSRLFRSYRTVPENKTSCSSFFAMLKGRITANWKLQTKDRQYCLPGYGIFTFLPQSTLHLGYKHFEFTSLRGRLKICERRISTFFHSKTLTRIGLVSISVPQIEGRFVVARTPPTYRASNCRSTLYAQH